MTNAVIDERRREFREISARVLWDVPAPSPILCGPAHEDAHQKPVHPASLLVSGGIYSFAPAQGPTPVASGATATQSPSRAQQLMGATAPKLAELTDGVLYGDIWERPQLSKRDRSLVTVTARIALNRPDQLRSHLALARQNGVTEEELIETITHMAFYSGWPSAVSAVAIAKEVFQKN